MNDFLDTIDEQPDPIEDCPCGKQPRVTRDGAYWTISCEDCYDGPGSLIGSGADGYKGFPNGGLAAAIEEWNSDVARYLDDYADEEYAEALGILEKAVTKLARVIDAKGDGRDPGAAVEYAVERLIQARRNLHRLDRLFPPDEKYLTPK